MSNRRETGWSISGAGVDTWEELSLVKYCYFTE